MLIDDLVSLIVTAGYGVEATSIFEGPNAKLPDTDGPFITLIETGGAGHVGTHNFTDTPAYVRPSVELIVSCASKATGRELAQALYLLLFKVRNRMVNRTWYVQTQLLNEPHDLSVDDAGRSRVAFNALFEKRLSPETSI